MKNTMQKLLAIMMSVMMLFTCLPVSAIAEVLEEATEGEPTNGMLPSTDAPLMPVVDYSENNQAAISPSAPITM